METRVLKLSDDVTIIRGDCLDVLPTMEAKSVDAVVTDPPYLVTDLHFDSGLKFMWVEELIRIVQNNGYLVSFGLYEVQCKIEPLWSRRFSGIWLKEKGGMRTHSAKIPKCQHEPFCVYAHPSHKISKIIFNNVYREGKPYKRIMKNTGYKRGGKDQIDRSSPGAFTKDGFICENNGKRLITDVLFGSSKNSMKHAERTDHPTQKPISVISVICEQLTNRSMVILDPFMGSGTTGVACIRTGRKFIGIEIDENYFDKARKRLERELSQQRFDFEKTEFKQENKQEILFE